MRLCSICKKPKHENDFFFRDKQRGILHRQCKQCYSGRRQKNWKDYYYKHGSKYRANALQRKRRTKRELQAKLLDYLSDKDCVRCGVSDVRVLDFDHINPSTKTFSIAQAVTNTMGWEQILIEIAKCQILCANCHKIKTATEQDWYRNRA